MYYVSTYDRTRDCYGITDTSDGVTEFYSKEDIVKYFKDIPIEGVSGKAVKVVNAGNKVITKQFDKFGDIVKRKIYSYPVETCMELARSAHFVKKLKECTSEEEVHAVTFENIYPSSVKEVVDSASAYTNELLEVDCSNPQEIIKALRGNMCLVLQHKTNGALTAFICTASLSLMDRVYGRSFFDCVYLTKQLYSYISAPDKVRLDKSDRVSNPDLLQVFSGSLRFRNEGVHHDGALKELSSPFYSVNIPRVLAMFVLNSPSKLGNRIIPEFKGSTNKDNYKFDFKLYKEISSGLAGGINPFKDVAAFSRLINPNAVTGSIDVTALAKKYDDNFEYMQYLRRAMYSFNI